MKLLIATLLLTAAAAAQTCDASLWQHVYHGPRFHTAKDRLRVITPCLTVSGTLHFVRIEKDGDAHYRLDLDPQFKHLLLPKNSAERGMLVVELMCLRPPTQRDTVAEGVCTNFHQQPYMSSTGHVSVTGAYVQDMEHGWAEIHPITKMEPQQ